MTRWETYQTRRNRLIRRLSSLSQAYGLSSYAEDAADEVISQHPDLTDDEFYEQARTILARLIRQHRAEQRQSWRRSTALAQEIQEHRRFLEGLTLSNQQLTALIAQGLPYREVAARTGSSRSSVAARWHLLRQYYHRYRAVTREPDGYTARLLARLNPRPRQCLELALQGYDNQLIGLFMDLSNLQVAAMLHNVVRRHPRVRHYLPRPEAYNRLYKQKGQ